MSTVTKTNMCERGFREPMSNCRAKTREAQEDCTHYFPASFTKGCMWFREDLENGCDNWWAQNRKEMPPEILEMLKRTAR